MKVLRKFPDMPTRRFEIKHRAAIREIRCETSFLEKDRGLFMADDEAHRGRQSGDILIDHCMGFLKEQGVGGVHFGTMSEEAKALFMKSGFELFCESKRSYAKYRIGE